MMMHTVSNHTIFVAYNIDSVNDLLQVCPICANNLGKDMAAHFRLQHTHLLKVTNYVHPQPPAQRLGN
jgi:hypothetical protein